MPLDQLLIGKGALVVGGVRLVHQTAKVRSHINKFLRGGSVEMHNGIIAEIEARLHDDADNAAERIGQPEFRKLATVRFDRAEHAAGVGWVDLVPFTHAARRWNLGADNIEWLVVTRSGLGRFGKARGALGHNGFLKDFRIVTTAHRTIEVDFLETRTHVGVNHCLCLGHRSLGVDVPPRLRAKVITAEQQLFFGQACLVGRIAHQRNEVGGLHSRISTLMIDLITGRFNERDLGGVCRGFAGSQNGLRMRSANARERELFAIQIAGKKFAGRDIGGSVGEIGHVFTKRSMKCVNYATIKWVPHRVRADSSFNG